MNIAILGTGRMGTGLARGWIKAGHQVTFGSRDPSLNRATADQDWRRDCRLHGCRP